VPVTDARQRVAPTLTANESALHHATVSFAEDMSLRNKRLVVHHYATRSKEDYVAKVARGAGDHAAGATLRGEGFFNALNECAAVLPEHVPRLYTAPMVCDQASRQGPRSPSACMSCGSLRVA
jgi:hypothetical protein